LAEASFRHGDLIGRFGGRDVDTFEKWSPW
jgi:hypothetical protein